MECLVSSDGDSTLIKSEAVGNERNERFESIPHEMMQFMPSTR